jgi:hypothetical protein
LSIRAYDERCLLGHPTGQGLRSMSVLDLRADFSRFRDASPRRINLAAHSHHEWPNVTFEAQMRCWEDAAQLAGDKWRLVFGELMPSLQEGVAAILNLPDPSTIAIAPNTHEFLVASCHASRRAILFAFSRPTASFIPSSGKRRALRKTA